MAGQKKIIFVNSFKGGSGKTTLSLTHCIDSLFHTKKYDNVIYLDLDILGTATSYLFEEGKLPNEGSFDKTGELKGVELKSGDDVNKLHVGYLSPEMKNSSKYGEPCFIHHQKLAEELFIKRVIDFIEKQIKEAPSCLIVLDCAPGFGEIEQKVLNNCYQKTSKGDVQIEEDYLVTLDAAQVKKCIQCLNYYSKDVDFDGEKRQIQMVINDVQNFCGHLKEEGEDEMQVMEGIMEKVNSETANLKMSFRLWKYSQKIAVNSVYTMRTNVENQVDDYMFTPENYIEWKDGCGFAYN